MPSILKVIVGAALFGGDGSEGVSLRQRRSPIPSFESFVELHQRSYTNSSTEYKERRASYEKNKESAELHNSLPGRLWTAGVNRLWDWSEAELKTLRGWDGSARPDGGGSRAGISQRSFLQQEADLPKEKIWSDLAMTKRVKNQGGCGSCWAVATSSVLEGHTEIYAGIVRTFSVQQIVSCTQNPRQCGGDGGCQGATAELGMDWVLKNGCAEETEVPYQGVDTKCTVHDDSSNKMAQLLSIDTAPSATALSGAASFGMTGWETLPKNEYEPLVRALAERGPVAVSVSAAPWAVYDSGIFNGCGKDSVIDHAVTAIGYGEENGVKYWLIQNSWGADWGEAGHIRLQRHDESEGYCGMNNDPEKGVACKGETAPVPVCGMCGVLFDSVVPHFTTR